MVGDHMGPLDAVTPVFAPKTYFFLHFYNIRPIKHQQESILIVCDHFKFYFWRIFYIKREKRKKVKKGLIRNTKTKTNTNTNTTTNNKMINIEEIK